MSAPGSSRRPQAGRLIAPSILSADFARLADEIRAVEEAGAGLLHVDVMDGHFVPNISLGPHVVESIRKTTELPLDCHLMISEPDRYVDAFIDAGADLISVHLEAAVHLHRTLSHIRERGALAGVAINPATNVDLLSEVLGETDYVLVMSVNPGFGGQTFIPGAAGKVRRLRTLLAGRGTAVRIEVDGGIGPGNARELIEAGADWLVAGSAIFGAAAKGRARDPGARTRGLIELVSAR